MHTTTATFHQTAQAVQADVVDTTDRIPLTADALQHLLQAPRTRVSDRVAMRLGLWLILWGSRAPRRNRETAADQALRANRIRATVLAEHERVQAHLALYGPRRF